MNTIQLQQWLVDHGQQVAIDGKCGPATRAAIIAAFTNPKAPAVTDSDVLIIASRLGCSTKQVKAVSKVESGGSAFDSRGRPKILFERHLFSRLTLGAHDTCSFSNRNYGGYSEDSWEKLTQAACKNVDAAFSSASWGKFQVLGSHWHALGYSSPLSMGFSTVVNEFGSYDMLARFIEANHLQDELRALSSDPDDCRGFAKGFNGSAYERNAYHAKLAQAMA